MFSGCTSLTQAPELSTTTLAEDCYEFMFYGCTSLAQAPELPATTLAEGCYSYMFSGCTSLTQAPELPATTLNGYCYNSMFKGCTGLTQALELPATGMAYYCYGSMFSGCTNLSQIYVSFDDWHDDDNVTYEWVENVASTGIFICPKSLPVEYGKSRIPIGWTVKNIIDGDTVDVPINYNYLTFTAEEDSSTFGLVNINNSPGVWYSLDGGKTWANLAGGDTVMLAHKGDKALLRGDNPDGFSADRERYSSFTMTGEVAASGSVMSLIDGMGLSTEIPRIYCFYNLFSGCAGLTQSPELPATTLTQFCYYRMFEGCTSLTQVPSLPATTLDYSCYESMFSCCTSLTQAPVLPATTMYASCYDGMFYGCTSLSEISVSFEDWQDDDSYSAPTSGWLRDVAQNGTFICPKDLPIEYGISRIPVGWTVKYIDKNPGVSSTLADGITVWTDGLTVHVRGAEGKISLYDMSGRIVAASNSADEERALCVPAKGVYVLRTNGGSSVVLVR
jgi:hypothetical protein